MPFTSAVAATDDAAGGEDRVSGAVEPAGPATRPTLTARETRWAGAALALGATLFVLGTFLGLDAFEGDWDTSIGPTLPDTAALIHEKWPRFRAIWSGELLGSLLMALAAFVLQRRAQASARWLPAGVAWTVIGIGSVLVAVSYGLTLGGYPAALAAFQEQPALFATLRGCVLFLHAVGSILQLLGVLGALLTEVRWRGRAPADRLLQVAAVLLGAAIWMRPAAPAALGRDAT